MIDRIRTIVFSTLEPEDKNVLWLKYSEEFVQYELLVWEKGAWIPILSEIANYNSVLKYIDGKTYVDLGDRLEEVNIYSPATLTADGLMSKEDKAALEENNKKVSNVQGDWREENPNEESYIKNKTHGVRTEFLQTAQLNYDQERDSYTSSLKYSDLSLVQGDYYSFVFPSNQAETGLPEYTGEFICQDTGNSYVLDNGQVRIQIAQYGTIITGLPKAPDASYDETLIYYENVQQLDQKYLPDSLLHGITTVQYIDTQTPPLLVFKDINGTIVSQVDATPFITDGMVQNVTIENGKLIFTFNDPSIEDIEVPISDIFDASNYYTKAEVDDLLEHAGEANVIEHINNYDGQELIPANKIVTLPHYTVADILLQNSQDTLKNELDRISEAILNRPTTSDLSEVAFSGDYEDLSNKPDLSQYVNGIGDQSNNLVQLLIQNQKITADLNQETKDLINNIPNSVINISTGNTNGTIKYETPTTQTPVEVSVKGLKSAAYQESSSFEPSGARAELTGQPSDSLDSKLTLHALDNQLKWQNIVIQ